LVWREEALLLQDGSKGVRLGVAATFWSATFWRTTPTRHVPLRLQRWVPQLLPLLEVAVVPGEEAILLQKREQRVQVEHGAVGQKGEARMHF
jgi:hypothetical protein